MNSPTYRFIPEMFRRVMRDEKTQTRRVIVPQPTTAWTQDPYHEDLFEIQPGRRLLLSELLLASPYGPVGTVKPCVTQWAVAKEWNDTAPGIMDPAVVLAEHGVWFNDLDTPKPDWAGKTRPAMFFPKQFYPYAPQLVCRAVKAERVQDISEADAMAEGVPCEIIFDTDRGIDGKAFPKREFRTLWDSINDRRGYGWAVNPFVFATTFERQ